MYLKGIYPFKLHLEIQHMVLKSNITLLPNFYFTRYDYAISLRIFLKSEQYVEHFHVAQWRDE